MSIEEFALGILADKIVRPQPDKAEFPDLLGVLDALGRHVEAAVERALSRTVVNWYAKGPAVRVLDHRAANGLSDISVDCSGHNAVHVEVYVTGTTPSATVSVEGGTAPGGNYAALPDPNASQAAVAADTAFDVLVGAPYAKIRIASISGTYGAYEGYTVIVTPYTAAGQPVLRPGSAALSLGKLEDAAHASGDAGVMLLAVRTDTATARAGTDGDYIPVIVDGSGRLHVNVGALPSTVIAGMTALPAGTNNIGDVDVLTEPSGSGSYTTATHSTATVTTSSGAALATNSGRLYALFQNDSDTTIYLMIGATAVASQGIRLNANGGSYEMSAKLGNLNTGAVNAIHAGTGNKVLLVLQGT